MLSNIVRLAKESNRLDSRDQFFRALREKKKARAGDEYTGGARFSMRLRYRR
jgi:hypothetical protein